jgi:hypothetical protein
MSRILPLPLLLLICAAAVELATPFSFHQYVIPQKGPLARNARHTPAGTSPLFSRVPYTTHLHSSKADVAKDVRRIKVKNNGEGQFQSDMTLRVDRDAMIARAGVLRRSILTQQIELQRLERSIQCCSQSSQGNGLLDHPIESLFRTFNQTKHTFFASSNVLLRKLGRVRDKTGPNNKKWTSVGDYMVAQTKTGVRIVGDLVKNPDRLMCLVDPDTPTLVPHVPAILARLDKLESHVVPILEKVLNNRRHLASIEPYLDEVLERFDDIEPHLPWILENIDVLAPYTGLLLKHVDELLLYATSNESDGVGTEYALAEQLLPYLEYYVSRLDMVGPHLALLRPHIPKLLKHKRIAKISPHIDRLFAGGYLHLGTSANLDVLLFWFGWTLQVPFLPRLFFAIPGSPRIVQFLACRFPKRFVRGFCSDVSCSVDGDYGGSWNKLSKI